MHVTPAKKKGFLGPSALKLSGRESPHSGRMKLRWHDRSRCVKSSISPDGALLCMPSWCPWSARLQRDCVIGSILARNQYCHVCLGYCDEPAQTWVRTSDPLGDNNWAQGLTHFYDKAKIRKSSAGSFNTRGVVCCPHPLLSIFLFSLPGPFSIPQTRIPDGYVRM